MTSQEAHMHTPINTVIKGTWNQKKTGRNSVKYESLSTISKNFELNWFSYGINCIERKSADTPTNHLFQDLHFIEKKLDNIQHNAIFIMICPIAKTIVWGLYLLQYSLRLFQKSCQ